MQLSENEAIQLICHMLGESGKPLAERMEMDPETIYDALNNSTRLYRDKTRTSTKEFFDRRLDEGRDHLLAYISSVYDWLTQKKPEYSSEVLTAIAAACPTRVDGTSIDWSSVNCLDDFDTALKSLPNVKNAAKVLIEYVKIESRQEQKLRTNRAKLHTPVNETQDGNTAPRQDSKNDRLFEPAEGCQEYTLPTVHIERAWLLRRILSQKSSVVAIEAPVGFGKTTLLSCIASRIAQSAVFVRCKWDDPVYCEQLAILDLINTRLSALNSKYKNVIKSLSKPTESPSEKVNSTVSAMQKTGEYQQPTSYIIIDALDELKDSRLIYNLLDRLSLAGGFGWIKVICSTRKWSQGREDFGYSVIRPAEDALHSKEDIESYALRRLMPLPRRLASNAERIASTIASKSNGIFQYAVIVLDALSSNIIDERYLEDLPPGIFSLYDWYLSRYLDSNESVDRDTLVTILYMVTASPSPVPEEIITSALLLGARPWNKTKNALNQFLVSSDLPEGTLYSLFHKSFADYLFSSRHDGKPAEEEGIAYLALGCYRANRLDRLSPAARNYIQVYLLWLLFNAKNNALLDVPDFDLGAVRQKAMKDTDYADGCLRIFEPAKDVIAFRAPAREEIVAWSAMRIYLTILQETQGASEDCRNDKAKQAAYKWLYSCNHYVFVLSATYQFDKAMQDSDEFVSIINSLDIESTKTSSELGTKIIRECALMYETIAYDVLTVGQPALRDKTAISEYYSKAISLYASLNDAEGYLKAACNKALYEVEHRDPQAALNEIRQLLASCDLQRSLLTNFDNRKLVEISNPCKANSTALVSAESILNHLNNLGYCLTVAGKEVEGLEIFSICESMVYDEDGTDRKGPFNQHDKSELFHLKAIALYRLGEYGKVIECEEKAIPGLQETWGVQSTKLCGPYNMMGTAHLAQGDTDNAIRCYEKALSIALANWGQNHSRLINIQLNLARAKILHASERISDDSKALFQDAAKRIKAVLATSKPATINDPWENQPSSFLRAQSILAELLDAKGKKQEALRIQQKIVETYRSKPTLDARSLGSSLLGLASLQLLSLRYNDAQITLDQAKQYLRECLRTVDGDYSKHPLWIKALKISHEIEARVNEK